MCGMLGLYATPLVMLCRHDSTRGGAWGTQWFSRAASGHCYFNLKDASGQIRCAMFRRAAEHVGFSPRDGELVEVRGRLGVYEQRGDLQLVVETMQRAGQGALFEQFLRLKAQLEAEGLFEAGRKRSLPPLPRGIGVVTSLGAAALHDVITALRRRVPHIPVVIVPTLVQGAQAPQSLVQALSKMYRLAQAGQALDGDLAQKRANPYRHHLAGAWRWLAGRPLGFQRRATGAHHCAKPRAAGQRRGS